MFVQDDGECREMWGFSQSSPFKRKNNQTHSCENPVKDYGLQVGFFLPVKRSIQSEKEMKGKRCEGTKRKLFIIKKEREEEEEEEAAHQPQGIGRKDTQSESEREARGNLLLVSISFFLRFGRADDSPQSVEW